MERSVFPFGGLRHNHDPIPFEDTGAELRPPPFGRVFRSDAVPYIFLYFIGFQLFSQFVKRTTWQEANTFRLSNPKSVFRRYRLQNLTVCFVHSSISGLWAFGFLLANPHLMFYHVIHWYEPFARHLVLFSCGYFLHDMVDLLRNEWSRFMVELLLHHAACLFIFSCSILPHKFLLYVYWALLMEINSIFLHVRTISQLSGASKSHPSLYKVIRFLCLTTFFIFRFGVQTFQLLWILINRGNVAYFYFCVSFYGGILFLILNICLLVRLLIADKIIRPRTTGLLSFYTVSRDDQAISPTQPELANNSWNGQSHATKKSE